MSENGSGTAGGGGQAIIARFWGFEKLIGSALVKIVYYVGLICIAIGVLVSVVGSLGVMMTASAAQGLFTLLASLVGGAFGVVMWRFFCELSILAFQTYHRLGEIRDRLPPPAA
jgi:hypothetical protein